MRVGISLTSNYPSVKDPRQGARWMIERAAASRRAGLDSLFVGDQHVSATPYYQNTPVLGRLLAEWGEASAGCLFLLPLWHPVLVAEPIGTLAAIARGRFIMQCGLGWGGARFAAMGANITTRPSAFEEALDIVRRLLAGEKVSSSRRFQIADASLALRPAEAVEVWIGASAPPAIDRAARLAEGWIASPDLTRDQARVQADMYRERCTAYSKGPGAIVLRRDIYVGESPSEAQTVLQHAVNRGYRGMPAEALIAGSVEEVTEQFRAFAQIGYTEILVRHLTNDQPKVLGAPMGCARCLCRRSARGSPTTGSRPKVGLGRGNAKAVPPVPAFWAYARAGRRLDSVWSKTAEFGRDVCQRREVARPARWCMNAQIMTVIPPDKGASSHADAGLAIE